MRDKIISIDSVRTGDQSMLASFWTKWRHLHTPEGREEYLASEQAFCDSIVIEPAIIDFASTLSEDYKGGSWEFFALSNGGFFMAPRSPERFLAESPNQATANMTKEAFGIATCLFAFSNLSFSSDPVLSEMVGEAFHKLRDFALDHAETSDILSIID